MNETVLAWMLFGLAAWALWAFDGLNTPGPFGHGIAAGVGWLLLYAAAGPVAIALLLPLPNRF